MYGPTAVSAGGDLVRDVDTAFAWKPTSKAIVDARNGGGSTFDAVASCLAVWCGCRSGVERFDPTAATSWHSTHTVASQVSNAGCQAACDLTTCYGPLSQGCTHNQAQNHNTCKLK